MFLQLLARITTLILWKSIVMCNRRASNDESLNFAGFSSKFQANYAEILPSISTFEYRRSSEGWKVDAIVPSSSSLRYTTNCRCNLEWFLDHHMQNFKYRIRSYQKVDTSKMPKSPWLWRKDFDMLEDMQPKRHGSLKESIWRDFLSRQSPKTKKGL